MIPRGGPPAQGLPAALWLARAALAGVLAAAAAMKLAMARPELGKVFAWTASVPPDLAGPVVTLAGAVELVAAIAIVVPPWNATVARLSRIAASGTAAVTAFAAAVQLALGDLVTFRASLVFACLGALVAWGCARQARRDSPVRREP